MLVSARSAGPYSAVPAARNTVLELHAEAEALWAGALARRPDLAPAIELQRALLFRQIDLLTKIGMGSDPIREGVFPLQRFATEVTRLPCADALVQAMLDFCTDLADGGAGQAAAHVRTELSERRLDPESLLRASLGRNAAGIREGAARVGVAPDLLWLVGELAAAPLAHALAIEHGRTAPREADEGRCAFCGSRPALAEVTPDGRRALRCSFCATAWSPPAVRCAHCGASGEGFGVSPLDADGSRAVELCRRCGTYLKLVRVPSPVPFPLVAIVDLATNDLDVAAMERGFTRPPLGGDAAA
jgi:hypothetical protein